MDHTDHGANGVQEAARARAEDARKRRERIIRGIGFAFDRVELTPNTRRTLNREIDETLRQEIP